MSDRDPIEEIKRLADAMEAHPGLPFTEADQAAVRRIRTFLVRLDALIWFLGWGKWVAAILVVIATQWDRIAGAWSGWNGQ